MTPIEWPGDRRWIFVDVLTTSLSEVKAGKLGDAIVKGVGRLARVACDVGHPHVVIGEDVNSLELLTGTLLAPAVSLSSQWPDNAIEHFGRAWAEGCSCSWSVAWKQFAMSGLPSQLSNLMRQHMPQVLLYGGADVQRFLAVALAFRAVTSRIWTVAELVRSEVLDHAELPVAHLATLERGYTDWRHIGSNTGG